MKNKLILFLLVILFSCSRKEKLPVEKKVGAIKKIEVSSEPITAVPMVERKKYIYEGLIYRDPFIPVSPEKMAKAKLGLTKEAVVPGLGILQIKGVIVDKKDKIALFSSPIGSYLLVNGRLYDSQNRLVKGITGRLLYKEGSATPRGAILVSEDNYYKEYYLPEEKNK